MFYIIHISGWKPFLIIKTALLPASTSLWYFVSEGVKDVNLIGNCVTHLGSVSLIFDPMIFLIKEMVSMNATEENGNLHKLHGTLKQRFAILIEDDSLFQEGLKQEVFGKRQIRIGKTEEELDMIIAEL